VLAAGIEERLVNSDHLAITLSLRLTNRTATPKRSIIIHKFPKLKTRQNSKQPHKRRLATVLQGVIKEEDLSSATTDIMNLNKKIYETVKSKLGVVTKKKASRKE